ncbi:hypothetical protein OG2516_06192 [Oceanicola granulosus HTCC2516]|uniref:Lipoprotein n=1 Tax=Oceanicola granulosus (strain ATCC BAA-861 / DSM 15982 / KCTC 12143 / HTCC2516) TaxID=314256 RepID=Q2CDC6_OCEGH|nr:hypothetical protein [Oceanicola granulosus]EAR50664.1 hypothetical protein OG2516_06192 [Oceanicola granulosus HTCC2516]
MRPTLPILCAVLALSGCAQLANSPLNPMNLIDRLAAPRPIDPANRPPLVTAAQRTTVVEGRPLVAAVREVALEPTGSGAILRATGEAAALGAYNVQLTREGVEGSTLVYAFRAEPAPGFQPEGTPATRRLTAAVALDAADLRGVTALRVVAQGNSRAVTR